MSGAALGPKPTALPTELGAGRTRPAQSGAAAQSLSAPFALSSAINAAGRTALHVTTGAKGG
jgi:hypothetical protein